MPQTWSDAAGILFAIVVVVGMVLVLLWIRKVRAVKDTNWRVVFVNPKGRGDYYFSLPMSKADAKAASDLTDRSPGIQYISHFNSDPVTVTDMKTGKLLKQYQTYQKDNADD